MIPYKYKLFGVLLIIPGIVFAILHATGIRIDLPVFAVVTSFIKTRYFVGFSTNVTDELTLIFLISGIFLLAFSREKTETELTEKARIKAFFRAMLINTLLLLGATVFTFGSSFISVLILNILSFQIIYLVCFRYFTFGSSQKKVQ